MLELFAEMFTKYQCFSVYFYSCITLGFVSFTQYQRTNVVALPLPPSQSSYAHCNLSIYFRHNETCRNVARVQSSIYPLYKLFKILLL